MTLRTLLALPSGEDDEPEFRRLEATLLAAQAGAAEDPPARRRLADPPIGPLPFQLGNYELLECIGRGAWGAVYRARHTKLDLLVAIKVLDTARLSSQLAVDRFLREAQAAGQLRHPNIVRATDAGQQQGLHYLAMELIEGIDAARLLQLTGPLRVADACEIIRQAAVALEFAHQQSWVHRDVKPSNLMVTYDGQVQLLDLGIAGKHGDQMAGVEQPLGTAEYMAPEQWHQFNKAEARADVYGLGCTLVKLLTGHTPTNGGALLRPLVERDDMKRGLERFVARMIHQDPDKRIATASEVAQALRRPARGANLSAIAIRATPLSDEQREKIEHRVEALPRKPILSKLTRRALLAAGSAIAVYTAAVPWTLTSRSPRLRRFEWRALEPSASAVWFEAGGESSCQLEVTSESRLRVAASGLSLMQLGRAISGPFSFRVAIRQEDWPGGTGLFFRGRRSTDEGYRFQMIEIRPADDPASPLSRRLLWSDWSATLASPHLPTTRTALAEAQVELRSNAKQLLEVTFGSRGCPVVRWNRETLAEGAWLLSSEGRRQTEVSPLRSRQECLGYLGLVSSRGVTEFSNPELSYL